MKQKTDSGTAERRLAYKETGIGLNYSLSLTIEYYNLQPTNPAQNRTMKDVETPLALPLDTKEAQDVLMQWYSKSLLIRSKKSQTTNRST